MISYLDKIDQQLFLWLNSHHNEFFDGFMLLVTNKTTWYPLYAVIIAFLIFKLRKDFWLFVLVISLTITIADQVSSGFLKPTVERLRPCKNETIADQIHIPGGCGGLYGFTSSHASNHFAVAMLLALIGRKWSKWVYLFFPWAAIIAYSRVYVGVHYPGDIIVGGIIGIIGALIAYGIGNWASKKYDISLVLS
jgi:undecaprenyl-diphosphatase